MIAMAAGARLASVAFSCDACPMIHECNIAAANTSFFYYVEVPDHADGREDIRRALDLSEWIRENLDERKVHRFFDRTVTRYFFTTYEDAFAFQMVVP